MAHRLVHHSTLGWRVVKQKKGKDGLRKMGRVTKTAWRSQRERKRERLETAVRQGEDVHSVVKTLGRLFFSQQAGARWGS